MGWGGILWEFGRRVFERQLGGKRKAARQETRLFAVNGGSTREAA
jgi:hypothetical protein